MPYDAIIIGGGPAGSSAAISLQGRGARALVLEEKHMPRGKLCGEFITPECFASLERLGVMDRMISAGAQKLSQVSLVVPSGKSVQSDISNVSHNESWALSLSRARFDQILFDRAREIGAECLEGIAVSGCQFEAAGGRVEALSLKEGKKFKFDAPVIIDASGRNSRSMVNRRERVAGRRGSRLYALKAHFRGVEGIGDRVELYFFTQGYGGLSRVEDGLANLCFIVSEQALKDAEGDPAKVIKHTVMTNPIASDRLRNAEMVGKWYSTGPLSFGQRHLSRNGIIAVGDASGMIDPFTGTGLQMALRTGEIAADAISESVCDRGLTNDSGDMDNQLQIIESAIERYRTAYKAEFNNRMRAAGLLRSIAFSPQAAGIVASVLARTPKLTDLMLRATRSGSGAAG